PPRERRQRSVALDVLAMRPRRAGRQEPGHEPLILEDAHDAPCGARCFGRPSRRSKRAVSVVPTAAMQTSVAACDHGEDASVPVPSECAIAAGHETYARRCTARQTCRLRCRRTRLVTISAATRSSETVPSPTKSGRQCAANGTSTDSTVTPAYGSSTAVTTWIAMNTTASSERLRWSPRVTKLGARRGRQRLAVAMPSTVTTVNSTKETRPVARIRYQSVTSRPPGGGDRGAGRHGRRRRRTLQRPGARCLLDGGRRLLGGRDGLRRAGDRRRRVSGVLAPLRQTARDDCRRGRRTGGDQARDEPDLAMAGPAAAQAVVLVAVHG